MQSIDEPKNSRIAFLQLGFRPFFLYAGIFAILCISIWGLKLQFGVALATAGAIPAVAWHAHEMIYGYALAVVAGFLLTSVRNWTNIQTLNGVPLLLFSLSWMLARLLGVCSFPYSLPLMTLFDLLFATVLCSAIGLPLLKARQWAQCGIWVKLCLLLLSNLLFYLD